MYTKTELSATREGDKNRIGASGDPSSGVVNISISQLRVGDTDRYRCEFVVENAASADLHLPGRTDYFLLVTAGEFASFKPGVNVPERSGSENALKPHNYCRRPPAQARPGR